MSGHRSRRQYTFAATAEYEPQLCMNVKPKRVNVWMKQKVRMKRRAIILKGIKICYVRIGKRGDAYQPLHCHLEKGGIGNIQYLAKYCILTELVPCIVVICSKSVWAS
jgi:hypothetical protein